MSNDSKSMSKLSRWMVFCLTIGGIALTTLFTIAVGIFGIMKIQQISKFNNELLYLQGVKAYSLAAEISQGFTEYRLQVNNLVFETNPGKLRKYKQQIDETRDKYKDATKRLAELVKGRLYREKCFLT